MSTGSLSNFSNYTSGDFTVSVPGRATQSVAAPTPIGPTGLIDTVSPTFTWTPVAGATGYLFLYHYSGVGENPYGGLPQYVTGTSITMDVGSPPSYDTTYSWWVMAYDAAGDLSEPSVPLNFTTSVINSGQPAAPTDLSPSGTITSSTPTFSWSAVPGYTSGTYGLTVVDETTGTAPVLLGPHWSSYQLGTSYTINQQEGQDAPLINGHTYQWYVSAESSDGSTPDGLVATQTFTLSVPADQVPSPSAPGPGAVVNTTSPTFTWSQVTGAVGYLVFVADPLLDSEFNFFQLAVSVTGNSYSPSDLLINGHNYYWQVSPCSAVVEPLSSGQRPTLWPSPSPRPARRHSMRRTTAGP